MNSLTIDVLTRLLNEAKVSASPEYMKKEAVREKIQEIVVDAISSGQVKSQEDLEDLWKTAQMSIGALKQVPYSAWQALKTSKKKK